MTAAGKTRVSTKEFKFNMFESDYIDSVANRLKPPVIVQKQSMTTYRKVRRP